MTQHQKKFIETVWKYYKENGRHNLPWRKTKNPYKILVSEVMLQQTQVDRVIPKYKSFIKKWGSVEDLAQASLGAVLTEWQGLGYNRRAKMLHNCALAIVDDSETKIPTAYEELQLLPGIGSYTAGAIMAFAYNKPVVMIETNIRTVYLHHFFKSETNVPDSELVQLIALTINTQKPREWYWALMDYGAYLKRVHGNLNRKSKHFTTQSKFEGSDRQIRGAIIRELSQSEKPLSQCQINSQLTQFANIRVEVQIERLLHEKLLEVNGEYYTLPS